MKGGGIGNTPVLKCALSEQDGSPVYQAQHAEKAFDVNHGRPQASPRTDGVTTRVGVECVPGESERPILARRAGNAAGAKGPYFRGASSRGEGRALPPQDAPGEDVYGAS